MIDKIIETTCNEFGVSRDELFSSNRSAPVADARCVAMVLVSREREMYSLQLSELFGRNRTTIIHARYKFNLLYGSDKLFTKNVDEVKRIVYGS